MESPRTPRTVPDARWSCRSCGACCRGFSFGPVEPEIIAGLEARDIAAHWKPAADAPWYTVGVGPGGKVAMFLTHRDGHCVFLAADSSCTVHRLFGAEAKPWFCREYPFHVVEDAQGLAVSVRADCGGLHESFRDGEAVSSQAAEAVGLPRMVPRPRFLPDQVVILPGMAVSGANWLEAVPHLLAALQRPMEPERAVAEARLRLYRMIDREGPDPDSGRYMIALGQSLAALRIALARQVVPPGMEPDVAHADALLARAMRASRMALPPIDDDARAYLGVVLRSELHTHRHGTLGGVPEGLGLHLLEVAIARLTAEGDPPLGAAQVGQVLSAWKRTVTLPPLWAAVRAIRPVLVELAMTAG